MSALHMLLQPLQLHDRCTPLLPCSFVVVKTMLNMSTVAAGAWSSNCQPDRGGLRHSANGGAGNLISC